MNEHIPNPYIFPEPGGTTERVRDIPRLLSWVGRLLLRILGFRVVGQLPNHDKFVLAAGPHTANLDGFVMVFTAWAFGARPDWMVKKELADGPFGFAIRATGGIPIDRRSRHNTVQQAVERIVQRDRIMLVVAPEGTRKKTDHWKTGFYWIAYHAQVPIVCGFIDYERKIAGVGPTIMPTGDIHADMQKIFDFYSQIAPRYPDNYSDMRLRDNAQVGRNWVDGETPAQAGSES